LNDVRILHTTIADQPRPLGLFIIKSYTHVGRLVLVSRPVKRADILIRSKVISSEL